MCVLLFYRTINSNEQSFHSCLVNAQKIGNELNFTIFKLNKEGGFLKLKFHASGFQAFLD